MTEDLHESELPLMHPLKGKVNNDFRFVAVDVEVYHTEEFYSKLTGKELHHLKPHFLCAVTYSENGEKRFRDIRECEDYLLSLCKKNYKDRPYMVACTNAGFDYVQIFPKLVENKNFHVIYRNKLLGLKQKSTILRKRKGETKPTRVSMMYTDTLNYCPYGVEALGKSLGIPKLENPAVFEHNEEFGMKVRKPKNWHEREELFIYCSRDAEITFRWMLKFQEFCNINNIKMGYTLGSCGQDFYRRNYQKNAWRREPVKNLRIHLTSGVFRGGMTQILKRGTYHGKVYMSDINAAYVATMRDGIDGKGSFPDPSTFFNRDNPPANIIDKYEGITDVTLKIPDMYLPPVGIKIGPAAGKKLVFPTGEFRMWASNVEIRKAVSLGADFTAHKTISYKENFIPFRQVALDLFKLRHSYPKSHPFNQMAKTLANSGIFGKWGMNFFDMQELLSMDDVEFDESGKAFMYVNKKKIDLSKTVTPSQGDSHLTFLSRLYESKPGNKSFPILSTYTTALSRIKLYDMVLPHQEHLIYEDTDSAFTTKPVFEDSSKLGEMKDEGTVLGASFAGCKQYQCGEKCKSKGVSRSMNTPEKWIDSVKRGETDFTRFSQMNESMKRGISSGSILKQNKKFSFIETKRSWLKPFQLDDWQESLPLKIVNGCLINQYTGKATEQVY